MKRFSMTFDNPGQTAIRQNIIYQAQLRAQAQAQTASIPTGNASKKIDLRRPMIDRVYKAKPGCSACGK